MSDKRCSSCGHVWHEAAFFRRKKRTNHGKSSFHYVCIGCELTERTNRNQRNRPREKARKVIARHGEKYVKQGLAQSIPEFAARYGWSVDQIAHDIAHSFENGCPYCRRPFKSMPHGLADVTLDIIDPSRPPDYRTNTRWVCATCNAEKQKTPPDVWGLKCQCWAQYDAMMAKREADAWAGTLFEGIETTHQRALL